MLRGNNFAYTGCSTVVSKSYRCPKNVYFLKTYMQVVIFNSSPPHSTRVPTLIFYSNDYGVNNFQRSKSEAHPRWELHWLALRQVFGFIFKRIFEFEKVFALSAISYRDFVFVMNF